MLVKKFKWTLLLLSAALTFTIFSCQDDKGEDENNSLTLSGDANGANERPNPVTTNATGTITGSYDPNTNALSYTITWTGLTGAPISAHFHGPATVNQAAGVVIPITIPANSTAAGTVSGTASLNDQQEKDLLGGLWYYNIHTDQNKGGEIRGQVTVK
jgi:hypothetical protein